MKQGSASHSGMGSTKVEPKAMAVSPGAVSRIGNMVAPTTKREPIITGKGVQAPMVGTTTHKAGSQGHHK